MTKPRCVTICQRGCREVSQCRAKSSAIIDGKPLCKEHAFVPLMKIAEAVKAYDELKYYPERDDGIMADASHIMLKRILAGKGPDA